MFTYQFNLTGLLTTIQITGPYVTLYHSGIDIALIIEELDNFRLIEGNDFFHGLIHALGPRAMHSNYLLEKLPGYNKHYHFMIVQGNIAEQIKALLESIFTWQEGSLRRNKIEALTGKIEASTILLFKVIETDSKALLMDDFLSRYQIYLKTPSLERCEDMLTNYFIRVMSSFISKKIHQNNSNHSKKTPDCLEQLEALILLFKKLKTTPHDINKLNSALTFINTLPLKDLKKFEREDNYLSQNNFKEQVVFIKDFLIVKIQNPFCGQEALNYFHQTLNGLIKTMRAPIIKLYEPRIDECPKMMTHFFNSSQRIEQENPEIDINELRSRLKQKNQ